ncbi:MAG: hypothetical protein JOZ15_13340 [Acidobacteria bacterium]|nr:hypothetical protein [Acidobacteriota bacterium]
MAERDKAAGMKSAYELALERLERQGIERPRQESVSDDTRRRLAEVRQQAEAKIAELEILHRDRLRGIYDPDKRREEEEEYVRERRRLEADRDRKLEKLRGSGGSGSSPG